MDNFGFQTSQGGGTSGIGGSGTTNYVSKFTASSTIGDSQLFDNGTNVGLGTILPTAKFTVQGIDSTASNFALKVDNSSANLFSIRNDGIIQTGTQGNFSLKIGNNTGSYGSGAANNSFGYACLSNLTTGSSNTAFGYTNLASVTTGINNTAFGYLCLRTITIQQQNAAFGDNSGEFFVGNFNSTFGSISLQNGTGDLNCAFGYGSLITNGAKNFNVAFGAYSGLNNIGDRNVFLGTNSGYRQTNVSNKLFVDNQDRTSAALELTNSLIVGTFDSVPNNQLLRFNASVGLSVDATAKLHIKGIDATSSNYAIKIDNSTPTNLFSIRNDGVVDIYGTITPRLQSLVSSANVTPTNLNDEVVITAQAVGLTLVNPTGTALQGQSMIIRIKDNGTAQTIAYDTQYRAIGVTLPTTTVINKIVYLGLIYNSTDTKWDCIGVSQEA